MRIVVVSDTHGKIDHFVNKLKSMDRPQLIIHLGDYAEDGEKIQSLTNVETIIVKGNGDYFNKNYEEDRLIEIGGKKFFITHGHKYNVRYRLDNLMYKGEEVNADIVLYGHTHVPVILKESNMIIMNPGSVSLPRTIEKEKTFGIIEIGDKVSMTIEKID